MTLFEVVIETIGWIYFAAWSVSFYGQIYENWKLKSVEGYALDYQVFNMTGFLSYTIFSSMGYFYQTKGVGKVEIQDLGYAYHALAIILVQGVQCLIYPKGKNKVSKFCIGLTIVIWTFTLFNYLLTQVFDVITPPDNMSFWVCFGYNKLVVTLVKYTPQAWWNYKRKSTVGWSIFNILCDIVGGTFSFLQIFLVYFDQGNFDSIGGLNVVKLGLSILTIVFDVIFLVQHYVLYKPKKNLVENGYDTETDIAFIQNKENTY